MDVQEELDGVLHWIAALLILLLQWLYPRVPWSHVLSRMFYDHLTLSHDLTYWVPTLFIPLLHYMLWGFGLSVQMHGKPFPVWGSHNNTPHMLLPPSLWFILYQVREHLLGAGSTCYSIPVSFLKRNAPGSSLATPFVAWPHTLPLPSLSSFLLLLCLDTPIFSAPLSSI